LPVSIFIVPPKAFARRAQGSVLKMTISLFIYYYGLRHNGSAVDPSGQPYRPVGSNGVVGNRFSDFHFQGQSLSDAFVFCLIAVAA
jgi:hypothetical protein